MHTQTELPAAPARDHILLRWLRIGRRAASEFLGDRCATLGASVAFYSAFSLAPTLLLVVSVAGWFFGKDVAQGRLLEQVHSLIGGEAASAMRGMIENVHHSSGSGIATALSIAIVLIGASATFSSLHTALDIVFDVKPDKPMQSVEWFVRARLVSFAFVLGFGFLLVVSLIVDTALQFAGSFLFGQTVWLVLATAVQILLSLAVLTIGFGFLIKWLPDTHVPRPAAIAGAFVSAVLFSIGRHLFGLYLSHAGTSSVFGTAGSLAVLMMWLYFSALVFLFGAEITAAITTAGTVQSGVEGSESSKRH
jgi:membrane protein